MRANFKFILRTHKADRHNRAPVYLRVTSNYKVKFISTGRKVTPAQWNPNRERVRSSHPESVEINTYLESFLNTVRERYRESGFQINAVNETTPGIIYSIDRLIETYNKNQQFRTRQRYETLKTKLKEFTQTDEIPFSRINKKFIQDFDAFLKLNYNNKINTRIRDMEGLKRTINLAMEDGLVKENPFKYIHFKRERGERRRLTIDEIKQLQAYDAPVESHRYHAKNMFLFSFYTGGGRFEDIVLLEWRHIKNGTLHFSMGKTGKQFSITLLPEAMEIIKLYEHRRDQKYVFPLMPEHITRDDIVTFKQTVNTKNSLVNKKLSVIAKHLELEPFTFHTARHSIADYLRLKGVDLYTISKVLRHSDLKTTEIYLKQFDADSVSAEFAKAFE